MPFRLRLRHRLWAIPTLLFLAWAFVPPTADAQPTKERTRQGSGDRSDLRSAEGSAAKAGAADRSGRTGRSSGQGRSSASKSTADRGGDGISKLDSATATRSSSDRKSNLTGDRINSEQQANVKQLQADLQVLAQGAKGAEDEIRNLAEDLQAMSPHQPDPVLVEDLASTLAVAVADGTLTPREMAELAAAVDAVLQSAGLSSDDVVVLIQDVEAILEAANVGRAEVQAVVDDLYAIVHSVQAPSGGSKTTSSSSSKRRRGRGRS